MTEENPFASPKVDVYAEQDALPRPPSFLFLKLQSAFRAIRAFVGVLLFLCFLALIGFGALEEVATSDNLESIVMGVVSALLLLSVGIYFWIAQPQNR